MPDKNAPTPPSGVLLVDKPEGVTSHDAVARTRRTLGFKKIGHAGTLDPFATGLLILLVGEGTKLSNYLMDGRKTYTASIMLGEKRDTADLTGEVTEVAPIGEICEVAVRRALSRFEGEIEQLPPMYSALKKDGVPLYKYARKGVDLDRKRRTVFIHSIELVRLELPLIDIELCCSKGTYVRTLAEDIAEELGTLGHLVRLRRTKSGVMSLHNSLSFEALAEKERVLDAMIPLAASIESMHTIVISDPGAANLRRGMRLLAGWVESFKPGKDSDKELARVITSDGSLVSIASLFIRDETYAHLSAGLEIGKSVRVFN